MRAVIAVALAVALLAALVAGQQPLPVTVYMINNTFSYKAGVKDPSGVAFGTWTDGVLVTGWGSLELSTNGAFSDTEQMYAAGYLEGAATAARGYEMWGNMFDYFWPNGTAVPPPVASWFAVNDAWMREEVMTKGQSDTFWASVGLLIAQMDGLAEGYNSVAATDQQLSYLAFQILSSVGDLFNLIPAVMPETRPDFGSMSREAFDRYFHTHTLCTGAIRVTPDLGDLLASHSAWFTYGSMNRIIKMYNFEGIAAKHIKSRQIAFSSYPLFLVSLDDYYLMGGSNLTMVQTTNAVLNMDVLKAVNTSSLLSWIGVRNANQLANSGQEWCEINGRLGLFCYSNQYMVIDRKLFVPGQPLVPNTLWVMDQIPGMWEASDLTTILAEGYYGSYNVPWHQKIWEVSGYGGNGPSYTYQMAPRAILFRAYAQSIVDVPSLQLFARYNNFRVDPLEDNNPMNAIASRGDLVASNPGPFGAIDSKVANFSMMQSLSMLAINGPTSVQQPVFVWTPEFSAMATHEGCPQSYDFDWEYFSPPW